MPKLMYAIAQDMKCSYNWQLSDWLANFKPSEGQENTCNIIVFITSIYTDILTVTFFKKHLNNSHTVQDSPKFASDN